MGGRQCDTWHGQWAAQHTARAMGGAMSRSWVTCLRLLFLFFSLASLLAHCYGLLTHPSDFSSSGFSLLLISSQSTALLQSISSRLAIPSQLIALLQSISSRLAIPSQLIALLQSSPTDYLISLLIRIPCLSPISILYQISSRRASGLYKPCNPVELGLKPDFVKS